MTHDWAVYLASKPFDWSSLIQDARNVIMGVSAIFACFIAFSGLSAWKREHVGKAEYELARRWLREVYRVRDAFVDLRNPFIPSHEFRVAARENDEKAVADAAPLEPYFIRDKQERLECVYGRRWRIFSEVMRGFEAEALEAEVLWGQDLADAATEVRRVVARISIATTEYLSLRMDGDVKPTDPEFQTAKSAIWRGWNTPTSGGNEFDKLIESSIRVCEELAKKRLSVRIKTRAAA